MVTQSIIWTQNKNKSQNYCQSQDLLGLSTCSSFSLNLWPVALPQVVENIARKFGINKSEFLDREADDLAVRIALGETQIIAETKKALANAGVNVASLEELASGNSEGVKRSNHVLLVKNLPYSSMESELSNMFGKFGSIDKIILPPTKTLALVSHTDA